MQYSPILLCTLTSDRINKFLFELKFIHPHILTLPKHDTVRGGGK